MTYTRRSLVRAGILVLPLGALLTLVGNLGTRGTAPAAGGTATVMP